MKRIGLALVAAAGLVGPGCASAPSFFHRPHFVKIRPITPPPTAEPREAARSAYYQSAVRAIDMRDYALALDMLQAARAEKPNDVAVLNAFGVVYDKLGRFDLSTRYYTQAAALDPNSPIVRQNLAYSARLQGKWVPDAANTALASASSSPAQAPVAAPVVSAPIQQAQAKPAAPVLLGAPLAAAPRPAITIASAPAPSVVITTAPNGALLTGRALAIIDASGGPGGESVRQQLASRGWTAPKSAMQVARVEARTRIVYPHGGQAVAEALARTLPFPAELAACDNRCTGISLIVGQDAGERMRSRS